MNINQQLGEDNKPVFDGGGPSSGSAENRREPICWTIYDEQRGDRMGLWGPGQRRHHLRESFDMWFNDVLGTTCHGRSNSSGAAA